MKLAVGEKPKCLREVDKHRARYHQKNLKYVKNNQVFYWRFLCWLEDTGYQPATIGRYYSQVKLFLDWQGSKSLRHVKKKDIEDYITHLKNSKRYKLYTLRYHREALCVFFGFVMRYSRMKVNPASNLAVRTHYPQPENMDFFTQDEIEMMMKKPKVELDRTRGCDFTTDYRFRRKIYTLKMERLILKILFSTGIRPCEISNMEIEDFRLHELKLRIRSKGNQQYIVRDRNVFVTKKTAAELQDLIQLQQEIRTRHSGTNLFVHYNGWRFSSGEPKRIVRYWASRCGIRRRVYAYMTRYTYCTRLVENGIDAWSLKKLMGHKQLAVTLKHYLKLTPTEIRKEWREFNPLSAAGRP
jgi:integrase/recombinase XerD